jgi:hypothetical protein
MSFEFFNTLGAQLSITLTDDPVRINPTLSNERALPGARIVSMSIDTYRFVDGEILPLTSEESSLIAWAHPTITLAGLGRPVTHHAPNGVHFTVRDLFDAVLETERQTRDDSEWFDGVDVHHVFFQGIHVDKGGLLRTSWGS